MSIKFFTSVEKVERKKARRYHPNAWAEAKSEAQASYDMIDIGYYLHLHGSHEALYVGDEEPEFKAGDRVSVVINREQPPNLTKR